MGPGPCLPTGTYDVRFIFGSVDAAASVPSDAGQFVSKPFRLVVSADQPPERAGRGRIVAPR